MNYISRIDKLAILYLILPLCLFVWGWLKIWLAIPLLIILAVAVAKLWCEAHSECNMHEIGWSYKEFIPALAIFVAYLFLTGMTGNWAQHSDYYVRNDIFWSLTMDSWPPELKDGKYFVYYFQTWLPSALVGKIFGWKAALWSYYIWMCIGSVFSLYYIFKYVGKCAFWIAFVFFAWNGLELIPCAVVAPLLRDMPIKEAFSLNEHVAGNFLTEAPMFSMKNIAHCFIPVSIICGMLLIRNIIRKIGPTLGMLAVMYSPMSAIFLLPILLFLFLREYFPSPRLLVNRTSWTLMLKELLSFYNLAVLLTFVLLIVPFYLSPSSISEFSLERLVTGKRLCLFLYYLIFNVFLVAVLIRQNVKDNLLWVVLLTHVVCIGCGVAFHADVSMKGSVLTTYFLIAMFCRSFAKAQNVSKAAYITYSILGCQYLIYMTGALAALIGSAGVWLIMHVRFRWCVTAMVTSAFILCLLGVYKPQVFSSVKSKLMGEKVRYSEHMGIYQPDGGSGLWWWYRTFGDSQSMPIWFR